MLIQSMWQPLFYTLQGICRPFPTFVKLDPSITDTPLTEKDLKILNHSPGKQLGKKSSQSLSGFLRSSGRRVLCMVPDGNCFFRALSTNIHGHQEEHLALRKLLTEFERANKGTFEKYLTKSQDTIIENHITSMAKPCTWATQIEVLSAASCFQIPIYSCHRSEDKCTWNIHRPISIPDHWDYPAKVQLNHFEMVYHAGAHYDSVINIETNRVSQIPPTIVEQTIHMNLD